MFERSKVVMWSAFVCGALSSAALFGDFTSNSAIARYVLIAHAVMAGPSVTPDTPSPSSDKCENCDGRGKIGDGRVMQTCPVCDGTGKKTTASKPSGWPPQSTLIVENPACDCENCDCETCDCGSCKPSEAPRRHNEIIVYTMPNCRACENWKDLYFDQLDDLGWTVEDKPVESRHKAAPAFRVWLNGQPHDRDSWMSPDDLRRLMETGSFLTNRASDERLSGGEMLVRTPTKRDQLLSEPSQRNWTHPEPLRDHLEGWPHNFDTTGLSYSEMKRLHNNHHEEIGPVSSSQLRAKSFNTSSSYSTCPGGNCPTRSTYTRRRGIFGGLFR